MLDREIVRRRDAGDPRAADDNPLRCLGHDAIWGAKSDPPAELAPVPTLHNEIGGRCEQASLSSDMSPAPVRHRAAQTRLTPRRDGRGHGMPFDLPPKKTDVDRFIPSGKYRHRMAELCAAQLRFRHGHCHARRLEEPAARSRPG
jgi:hypothetical protein